MRLAKSHDVFKLDLVLIINHILDFGSNDVEIYFLLNYLYRSVLYQGLIDFFMEFKDVMY